MDIADVVIERVLLDIFLAQYGVGSDRVPVWTSKQKFRKLLGDS